MPEKRCGHFALEVEEVPVVAAAIVLRVPIRRCALAERMIAIISQTNEGMAVARKLIFTASSLESVQRLEGQTESPIQIDPDKIRVAFGPDLEAIHPAECTIQRCLESCTPSYRMLLEQFG